MAVTHIEVCQIIDTSLTEPRINAMIDTAEQVLVTYVDPKNDTRVTTALRENLKTWLAAHYIAIADPRAKEESADGVRTVFRGKTDMGLEATMYGQQVLALDPTGALQKLKEGKKSLNFNFSEPRSETTEV